jgi:ribosomal protein S12 methylthiotransferase
VKKKQYKIGMVSLGCPKNQVDAEQMLGMLAGSGFEITPEQADADIIVVNTCGFIESAKEESIEAILEAARMKKHGNCAKVVIAGCLAQRYREELLRELPEADIVIGTGEIGRISEICEQALSGKERLVKVAGPAMVYGLPRVSTTPVHYRYLKIAEGCSNRCSYCAIPIIRGTSPAGRISRSWMRRAGSRTRARRNWSCWPRIPRPTGTATRTSRSS